jgi:signal transduction histidine kinase
MRRREIEPEHRTVLLLRWVLLVATAYLLLFRDAHHAGPRLSTFEGTVVAGYFATNFAVAELFRRVARRDWLVTAIAAFDAAAVSIALAAAKDFSADFFLLYFIVILVAAQAERLGVAVAVAAGIGLLHIGATSRMLSPLDVITSGAPLRISFLFVVAVFFGHLVERTREAERRTEEAQRNERLVITAVDEIVRAFKIPLGAMHAISEILLESPASLTREQYELLRRMHANSRHVSRFATSLLEARSIDAAGLTLDRQPVDVGTIVEEAIDVATTASDLKGISLEVESAPGLPRVLVDVNQMDRAVWNLIDNAIRSAPAGGEVFVSIDHTDRDVVVSISDDGDGISPSDVPAIFDKLRHVTNGFTTSGFGLFVAREIIHAHGGTIDVDSEISGGTTLTVRLPIARSIESHEGAAPATSV